MEKTVRQNIDEGKYTNQLLFGHDTRVEGWQEVRKAWYAEDVRLKFLFKDDLEIEYGFENHPKRDDLFKLAWDYGHSSGLSEVLFYYDDLSVLLT